MLNNCQGYLCLRRQLKRRKIIQSHLSGVHYLGQFSGWQFFGSNYHWSIILSEISLGAGCPGANYLGGGGNYRGDNFLGAISWEAIICWAKMWETIVRSSIIWAAIDRGSKIWGRIVRGSITMRAIAQGQLSRGQLCCSQGPHTHNNMKNITLFFIYCFHALALAYEQEKSKNNI